MYMYAVYTCMYMCINLLHLVMCVCILDKFTTSMYLTQCNKTNLVECFILVSVVSHSQHLEIIRDRHIMLSIMLCSDSQHQANYAHHFAPIMLTINSILQISTWQFVRKLALHDSFISTTHISVLRTDSYNYTRLYCSLNIKKYTVYSVDHLIVPYSLTLLCQHYVGITKPPKAMPAYYCACP